MAPADQIMADGVDATLLRWPATGPLLQACGIPLSVVVQPAGTSGRAPAAAGSASLLARCRHCYAYINHLCELGESSFTCAICGRATELQTLTRLHSQYCRFPAARQHLPELQQQAFEVVVEADGDQEGGSGLGGQQQEHQAPVYPVTLAVVDAAGPADFLDLVRGGLTVAMEALPPGSLFGLIGVSTSITLVDMAGPAGPLLHHLPVLESAPALVPLEDVMPLACLLVPVEQARRCLAQAVDLLAPDPLTAGLAAPGSSSSSLQQAGMDRRAEAAAAAAAQQGVASAGATGPSTAPGSHHHQQQQQQQGRGGAGLHPPCRAVGPAIQAVLEYLRGLHAPHLSASAEGGGAAAAVALPGQLSGVAQLLLFLSGPPDIGMGKTVAQAAGGRSAGGRAGSAAAAAAGRTISPANGDLSRQMHDLQLHHPVQDPQAKAFYEQAAVAAASMGVVVDVFAAARGYVGLQTLEPLVVSTGGALHLYPSAEEATLPQDLYRRLSTPKALCGMLRLRTSPQVRVSRCYGRLYADARYKDLFHVTSCDPGQAFVFDFEHSGSGVHDARFKAVTLQVAFQYATIVPAGSGGVSSSGGGGGTPLAQQQQVNGGPSPSASGFVVQRRLRVCTVRLPVALSPQEVYNSVDADTVLTVLTHKITKAVRTQSVSEARLLLRDWLVIFTANMHRNSYARASAEQLLKLPVDLTFSSCPLLQPLPRYVYALLRSPLLSSAAQCHSDLTSYLHSLWCALPPRELARAVYPSLTAFADPHTLIAARLPLSRHSLAGPALAEAAAAHAKQAVAAAQSAEAAASAAGGGGSGGEEGMAAAAVAVAQAALGVSAAVAEGRAGADVLLLDAFILVLVLYRSSASALPFPPPEDSQLWHAVADIKRERRVTTHVDVVREGAEGADLFWSLLIDDPDDIEEGGDPAAAATAGPGGGQQQGQEQAGAAGPAPTGVTAFIQHIKAEVTMSLQA